MTAQFPGQGILKTITGANPAAGAEASDAVPAGKEWKLLSYAIPLVTDATAATRIVDYVVDDGASTNRRAVLLGNQAGQTASLTRTHQIQGADIPETSFSDTETVLVSDHTLANLGRLPAGARIRTVTTALQAADDFGAPSIQVEEFDAPLA